MSTSTKSMNKNTTTSNSRSSKKPSKKVEAPVESVAQPETVTSTSVEVVENTVSAVDITPPKSEEVDVSSTSDSLETPVVESKPVVNIWELRKQARAAEEALKEANDAIEKIASETDAKSKPTGKPKAKPQATETDKPSDESDGFTKVEYKKKSFGKSAYKPKESAAAAASTDSADKPAYKPKGAYKPKESTAAAASSDSADKPAYKPKGAYKPKDSSTEDKPAYKPKGTYKPKEPTDEQVAYRERKNKALITAQDQLIAECVGQLHPKARDDINNSMPYIINYRRTLVVKFDSDSVVSEVDGEKFEFSRTRFFENRIFQDKVREKYDTLIPMAWIRFFPGRDENTYCMGIMKRRAEADA